MILAALLLSGQASADPTAVGPTPVGSLTEALDRRSSASLFAISCAPASEVITFLVTVAEATAGVAADPKRDEVMRRLVSAEGLESLGISGSGALSMVMDDKDSVGAMSLPFSGSAAQAQELLALVDIQAQPQAADVPTWWVPEAVGGGYLVELRDGQLDLRFGQPLQAGEPAPSASPAFDRALLKGLPEGRGCAIHLVVDPDSIPGPGEVLGLESVELAGFVPFTANQPALLRFRVPVLEIPLAFQDGVAPIAVRSSQPPPIMGSLGFSMADLLASPGLAERLDVRPSQLRRMGRWLNIDSGAVLGIYGDPRLMDFVAVLPLDESSGPVRAEKVTRRLARLARKTDLGVMYREPRALGVLVGEAILHAQIRDGRVVVGLDSQRVMDVAQGEGQLWGGPVSDAFAQEWMLAVMVGLDSGVPAGPLPALGIGVRGREDYLELGVQLRDPWPVQTLISTLSPILGAGFALPTSDPPALNVAEIAATMESIALAQQVHRSVHGTYLALPPAPRLAEQADPTLVPWMRRAPWDRLGWAPEPPFTAGVFWVELDPESGEYTIFGECDLDGDGIRAQFRLRADEALERLSPADVY